MNDTKRCTQCGESKLLQEYGPNRRAIDGLQSECRPCHSEQAKSWYQANRDAVNARRKVQRESNRDARIEYLREYHKGNRLRAIEIYGGRCAECGSGARLEFDHVNYDGAEHRELEHATKMHRRIVQAGRPLTDYALQLLCFTHHRAKTRAERWGT